MACCVTCCPQELFLLPVPVSTSSLTVDISSYIPDLKQHITSAIDSLRKDLMRDFDADIDNLILQERQWWHDKISALASEWSSKRPQLSRELYSLLEDNDFFEIPKGK